MINQFACGLTLILTFSALSFGCGEPNGDRIGDASGLAMLDENREGSGQGGPNESEFTPEGYPSAPYGFAIGDVTTDRAFFTDEDRILRLSDLHADPSKTLLLVFGTTGWCSRCSVHMPGLIDLHEKYAAQGLFLAVSIHENANYVPAKISDAHGYRRRYALPFNVLADTDAQLLEYFEEFSMPMILAIDLRTMKIVRLDRNWSEEEVRGWLDETLSVE